MENEELKTINIQIIATYLFIASLFISLLLSYNEKFEIQNKDKILTDKNSFNLSVFNRIFVVGLSLTFLYINYTNFNNAKKKKKDLSPFSLQITASQLTVLSSIIVLYVVITSGRYSIVSSVENPSL